MNKSQIGLINQQGGIRGETIIMNTLLKMGYNAELAKTNQMGYDITCEKGKRKYVIQVKTDMNNDGQYPTMTPEQIIYIKQVAKDNNYVPVLVMFQKNNLSKQYVGNISTNHF